MEEILGEGAQISVPEGTIPVVAYLNGERVIIGEGEIDDDTGIFVSRIDLDNPYAKTVYDQLVDFENFSLAVRVSEVECYKKGIA